MRVRGVLFDFGYTLFAHIPLAATIIDCAQRLGVRLTADQAATIAGRIDAAAMAPEELAHARDLDDGVWAQRWRILYSIADELAAGLGESLYAAMHDPLQWVPYSSAHETLRSLHESAVAVGVVSNTGWDVRGAFEAHAMSAFVATFTLSYEIGFLKPDPQMFASACASLGLSPAEAVMVGDDPRADGGAVVAGIRTLLLPPQEPGSDNGLGAVLRLVADSSPR